MGTQAQQWKLTDSVVSATGVIIASYVPDGEVKRGSFVPDKVSEPNWHAAKNGAGNK